MQNRYVGDVGDFAKYALLRSIVFGDALRVGVVWCLYQDEIHNSDGRHIGYLDRAEYRDLDPELHDCLSKIVRSRRRSVWKISRAGALGESTIFFERPISISRHIKSDTKRRELLRAEWLSRALEATLDCDVVFFDPDNGLEIPSVPKTRPKAGKYIFLDELREFWNRGQSLIVYHHLNRTASAKDQTGLLKRRLTENFPNAALLVSLLFRRGSCRHFWIVAQYRHRSELKDRVAALLNSKWHDHFELCGELR
jgi:hypothetical protein